jgi:hypothetical protein
MPALLPLFCSRVPETIKGRAPQSWRAVSSACLHDVRYSFNVHCRRHGGGHAGRISGSIAEGGCHHVRQGNRNFSAAAISLAKPSQLSTQCRRKSAPRRVKFKRSPLPTSSRTSYAIEISQQRCICGRARILGNRRILIWLEFSWIPLSQRGTSRKAFTSIPPSTGALASTSR